MSLKIVFMGTPSFAVPALEALLASSHEVLAVFSQPAKPKDRGHKVQLTPVHQKAHDAGIPCFTPARLRNDPDVIATLERLAPDVIVVVAYGMILPQSVLDIPPRGCINIHGSLLPRWRGAAPMQRALLSGDTVTGITTMQMDAGLDTGDMLLRESIPIGVEDTLHTLHDRLAPVGAALIVKTLDHLDDLQPQPQPETGVTYADKVTKEEGRVDWAQPGAHILRQVAALNPWPGVYTVYQGQTLYIRAAALVDVAGAPGQILDKALLVGCGSQAIRILQLQRVGGRVMDAKAFLNGFAMNVGECFEICPDIN